MERTKNIIVLDFVLLIGSLIIILCPALKITEINYILLSMFLLYGYISSFKFLLRKNYRDFESLYTSMASLTFSAVLFFTNLNTNKSLALFILIWSFVLAIIKLIKCDYYHDLKNPLWMSKMMNLVLFLITGFISSINFNSGNTVSIIVIGYFFLINFIVELMHDVFEMIRG